MKKLLGIVVLGLLWCNVGYAKCIKGDCANGWGTYKDSNGNIYEGMNKNNKENGQGTHTYASSGRIDSGIWKNGYLIKPEYNLTFQNKITDKLIKIPLYVYILDIDEGDFQTTTTHQSVKDDLKITNIIWSQAAIFWDLKKISYIKANVEEFSESKKWIKENCVEPTTSKHRCVIENWQHLQKIYEKLINRKKNVNKRVVNVYYIPHMLHSVTGTTYKPWSIRAYIIIGQRGTFWKHKVDQYTSAKTLTHELGHVLGIAHLKGNNKLMRSNGGTNENIIETRTAKSARNYYMKKLKKKFK